MDKKVCNSCGTENEAEYEYCKNCGAKLTDEANTQPKTTAQQGDTYNKNFANCIMYIEGIPAESISSFVGKNTHRIYPKFSKMEITGSKLSWCWPAAILGYFMGPIGVALWFIYRKMYKTGILILAAGILLGGVTFAVAGNQNTFFEGFTASYFDSLEGGNQVLPQTVVSTLRQTLATTIENVIDLASLVLGGLFGMYFYKKHAISKIKKYTAENITDPYCNIGLIAIGGTSFGFSLLALFVSSAFSMLLEKLIVTFV